MKKLLTLLCLLAIAAEFGYLLLKDHPQWPDIVWTPELWFPENSATAPADSGGVPIDSNSNIVPAGINASANPIDSGNGMQSGNVATTVVLTSGANPAAVANSEEASQSSATEDAESTFTMPHHASPEPKADMNEDTDLVRRALSSLVRVHQVPASGANASSAENVTPQNTGTGVIVKVHADGFDVLTASHVVEGRSNVKVELMPPMNDASGSGSRGLEALPTSLTAPILNSVEVLGRDTVKDLALLHVHWPVAGSRTLTSVPLDSTPQTNWSGREVWLGDLDAGSDTRAMSATVTKLTRARRDESTAAVEYLVLDKVSHPGMSGGGVFSSEGQLVGIVSGNGDGHMHCVAPSELDAFLVGIAAK
ncbi:S1 family peptidase [Neorhodopirellula lusitana]|uniref:S1 family peptidase n=1 Tax=Neorhodopirellula lusitana TaxID=445327 RepID=UPI00385009B0